MVQCSVKKNTNKHGIMVGKEGNKKKREIRQRGHDTYINK